MRNGFKKMLYFHLSIKQYFAIISNTIKKKPTKEGLDKMVLKDEGGGSCVESGPSDQVLIVGGTMLL